MPDTATLYDKDWYAWTQDQAARLRDLPPSQRPNGLDVEHLAEEVEDMGKSDRRAVESLLRNALVHLLKLEFHPDTQAHRGWRREVREFRRQLETLFRDSPSLFARREEFVREGWARALRDLQRDLEEDAPGCLPLPGEVRPDVPRYDPDREVLNEDWYPPPRG
jgi:hypothetical protein